MDKVLNQIPDLIIPWFKKQGRALPWRENADPYKVWISEIMLQQTQITTVIGYYDRFINKIPTIEALANVDDDQLMKLWEGLGYYSRAKNLKKAAKLIISEHNGKFPSKFEEILTLPGIGKYTAGAIASICFDIPVSAVDGNVLRVMARLFEDNEPINTDASKSKYSMLLNGSYPEKNCGLYTQGLMELGEVCCRKVNPQCELCPINEFCKSFQNNTTERYPVKIKSKSKKVEYLSVLIINNENKIALQKRTDRLLNALYELPILDGKKETQEIVCFADSLGLQPTGDIREISEEHIFTHRIWKMTGFYIESKNQCNDFIWADYDSLKYEYAIPTAFRKFLFKQIINEDGSKEEEPIY